MSNEGAPLCEIRLIVLDVDGTVLTPEHRVAPATRTAIDGVRANGARVTLASSRSPLGLRPVLRQRGLDDQWFVAYQGALVARWNADDELDVLAESRIDQHGARRVERCANEMRLAVGPYTGTHRRVARINAAIRREAAITGELPRLTSESALDRESAPHKLLVVAAGLSDVDHLHQLARKLPDTVTATFSHAAHLEITAAGLDKALGVRALADHLGVSMQSTAAIGDGLNDLKLFGSVGTSVAMGQASGAVKSAATYVTATNTADGVAAALGSLLAQPKETHR